MAVSALNVFLQGDSSNRHEAVPIATGVASVTELAATRVTLSAPEPRSTTVVFPVVQCESAVGQPRMSL